MQFTVMSTIAPTCVCATAEWSDTATAKLSQTQHGSNVFQVLLSDQDNGMETGSTNITVHDSRPVWTVASRNLGHLHYLDPLDGIHHR